MASLTELYFKTETLETVVDTLKKKGEKGIKITISISDDSDKYGQNASSYVSQTKEDREAKKPRYYVGNGKTFWTDGKITAAKKDSTASDSGSPVTVTPIPENDLPW